MTDYDLRCMNLAIEESKKCTREPGKENPTPQVGAVAVKNGKILDSAYRGEKAPGDHAEYTLLEKKLKGTTLTGATIYTTLEPCTTRGSDKTSCTKRLIERKVSRVVVGILDPNQNICGRGIRELRKANIITDLFPPELMSIVEEENRDFISYQETLMATTRILEHDVKGIHIPLVKKHISKEVEKLKQSVKLMGDNKAFIIINPLCARDLSFDIIRNAKKDDTIVSTYNVIARPYLLEKQFTAYTNTVYKEAFEMTKNKIQITRILVVNEKYKTDRRYIFHKNAQIDMGINVLECSMALYQKYFTSDIILKKSKKAKNEIIGLIGDQDSNHPQDQYQAAFVYDTTALDNYNDVTALIDSILQTN